MLIPRNLARMQGGCLLPRSFDHLVGASENCRRDGEAQYLRGLSIDDQLYTQSEFELEDRQAARLSEYDPRNWRQALMMRPDRLHKISDHHYLPMYDWDILSAIHIEPPVCQYWVLTMRRYGRIARDD